MNPKGPDHVSDFSEPEEYFNEITRDFVIHDVIHENITNMPLIENEPSIKTNITSIPIPPLEPKITKSPVTEQPHFLDLTLLPEIIEDKIKKISLNKKFTPMNFHFQKRTYLIGALLVGILILTTWVLRNPTTQPETTDLWQMHTERPLLDFFPEYQDWTDVEKEFQEASSP